MPIFLRLAIASTKPVLRGHDHWWKVARELGRDGATFTAYEIELRSSPGYAADVRDFCRRLVKGGIAERVDGRLRLLARPIETPRLRRDGTECLQWRGPQQMWNVLRREVGGVTAADLAILASTDVVPVKRTTAGSFLTRLQAAGVVVRVGKATPGVYRLTGSANTGPLAPKIMRAAMVFDCNTQQIVGTPEAEEEAT